MMNADHEIISALAYDYYVERNGDNGSPVEDWLKAEKEVEKVNAIRIEKGNLLKVVQKRGRVGLQRK
jgi:hypothetical protein